MRDCSGLWVQLEHSRHIRQGDWALSMRNGENSNGPQGGGASLLWSGRNGVSNAEGAALMAAWGGMADSNAAPNGEAAGVQRSGSTSSSSSRGGHIDTAGKAAPEDFINKEEALQAVRMDGRKLRLCTSSLREDRDVVLSAVSSYGKSLKYASAALREDPDVAEAAVRQEGRALQYVGNELRDRC